MGRADTKYKTEKRKANVGERILITKKVDRDMRDMTVGKAYEVVEGGYFGEYVEVIDDAGDQASAMDSGYEVIIEESTQASSHNENLVLTRLFNAEAEVDKLSRSIDELKRRIETLEKANEPKYTLPELIGRITDGNSHVPKLSPTRTANHRRAVVIKQAEAYIEDLRKRAAWERTNSDGNCLFNWGVTKLTFHVNAKKGVVTALAHEKKHGVRHVKKAFARCAPGDVFNDKIGMAIAAGRLYGVKIPQEFLDAPQPTEVVEGMQVGGKPGSHWLESPYEVIRIGNGNAYDAPGLGHIPLGQVVIHEDSEAVYE